MQKFDVTLVDKYGTVDTWTWERESMFEVLDEVREFVSEHYKRPGDIIAIHVSPEKP